MTNYAVGDIQGCLPNLLSLLEQVNFGSHDILWAAGDLVNRGPQSLETLRFFYDLGDRARIVLGNHDLHLLACWHGVRPPGRKDTFDEIFNARDADILLHWLQQQPLIHHDKTLGYSMVHAGIPPIWELSTALAMASDVEKVLRSDHSKSLFFEHMYGTEPTGWRENTDTKTRLRIITNYLTRMRFCNEQGELEFSHKGAPSEAPLGYQAWFSHPQHRCRNEHIIFGHWAAAMGQTGSSNFIGLDTGCVWGGCMTLLNLENSQRTTCDC